jgi:hypothetical protein
MESQKSILPDQSREDIELHAGKGSAAKPDERASSISEPRSAADIVTRGKALYEHDIRAQVEADNFGKYLVIDITTGKYGIGDTHMAAVQNVRAQTTGGVLFAMRIGFPALARI